VNGWLARKLWALLWRRARWLVLGAVGRTAVRAITDREVSRAADDLDARLSPRVRSALESLPGDPVRVGGGAVVATRTARRAGATLRRFGGSGRAATDRVRGVRQRLSGDLAGFGDDLAREQETARRQIRSDLALGDGRGHAAADDALLDLRRPGLTESSGAAHTTLDDPLDLVPAPVRRGRLRSRRPVRSEVARVQRSYRRPHRPWDR
jgi:hypothetical protein